MIKRIVLLLLVPLVLNSTNCKDEVVDPLLATDTVMPDRSGFWVEEGCFLLKYKSVIYEYKGKLLDIPIYGGTLPKVKYSDLNKLHNNKNEYLLGDICIKPNSGKVKNTVHEIIDFYTKDMGESKYPTRINREGYGVEDDGGSYIVIYDLKIEGRPAILEMQIPASLKKDKSLDLKISEINVDEEAKFPILFSIYLR